MDMGKLASFAGMTVGGAVGWYAGSLVGFMTAFMLSCVGTGVGMYLAQRAARRYFALALGLSLTVASSASAQAPAATPAPAPAPAPTPGQIKAATELMQVMHADKTLRDAISAAFDVQIQNNPAMAPYRSAMQQFANKYLTWDDLGPQLTTVYAQVFTESELKDLIAFYKSPIGQKLSSQQATLAAKSQAIGLAVVQAHQADLVALLRQQQNPATPPADTTKH
jgi:hypothetical protein